MDDGLSQAAVHDMAQDTSGYLWIATRDGLSKYDGSGFTVFRNIADDSTTIANNQVWRVMSDNRGGMWMATAKGISYYNTLTEEFENYDFSTEGFPRANDLELSADSMLLATSEGLFSLRFSDQVWHSYPAFKGKAVHFVKVQGEKSLLLGTNQGLFKLEGNKNKKILPQSINKPTSIYYTSDSTVLILDNGNLCILDKYHQLVKKVLYKSQFAQNTSITQDKEGKFWVSDHGIYVFDQHFNFIDSIHYDKYDPSSISNDRTTEVYATNDGTIWVGTNGFGLNKYNKYQSAITTITHNPFNPNTLANFYVAGLAEKEDKLYVGSQDHVDVFDVTQYPPVNIKRIKLDKSGRVFDFLSLQEDNLLLATENGLINLNTRKRYLSGIQVIDLAWLSPDSVLLATPGQGLKLFDVKLEKIIDVHMPDQNDVFRCLLVEDSVVWVGTEAGVYALDRSLKLKKAYKNDKAFSPRQVKCFYRDSRGAFWVGTWGYGMFKLDPVNDQFVAFEKNSKLPNETIYGIMEDGANNLWFSSNSGIICYQRAIKEFIRFSSDQGLQSNEFNTGAYLKSKNGRMFFGGIKGVSYFMPEDLLAVPSSSQLFITNVWVNQRKLNKQLWAEGKLDLPPSKNNIRIDYTAVSFSSANGLDYRYRVEGEGDYIPMGPLKSIHLTNLSHGDYKIIINATDAFGRWQKATTSIALTVQAPLWKRLWFQVLVVALLIIMGIVINVLRTRRYRLKNIKLEKAVRARTIEVTEQNNEILAQNEELAAQGETLSIQNEQLEKQRKELMTLKNSLEQKVEERTKDLKDANEELLEQYQQMEQFSYITSHNLRGPVASLKGLLTFLPDMENPLDQEVIGRLKQSVLKLDSIITDLGKIIEFRKQKAPFEILHVNEIVKSVISDINSHTNKGKVHIECAEFDDVYIEGVSAYLYSIVYNLITNGIKYADKSKERPKVKVNCYELDNNVFIEVRDNGIGMDMKYVKNKLFKLFQRFNDKYEGEGIGLYMTKIQAEAMNGQITLHSEEGEGTAVQVRFPECKEVSVS